MSAAVPILPVRDLQQTQAFYRRLGLKATFHDPDYLIMRTGPVELHFGRGPDPAPASCYVDTDDARRPWEEFPAHAIDGLGPVEDFDYGMREFVLTDPDGNRPRIGSSIPQR
jgi:catechol 2,3-dioxygenase-like lactoylglutathione lyase family enzyme